MGVSVRLASNMVTSIMQEQDPVRPAAGRKRRAARTGLIVVLQQQNQEPMENQQLLKLAPRIDYIDPPALLSELRSESL